MKWHVLAELLRLLAAAAAALAVAACSASVTAEKLDAKAELHAPAAPAQSGS